MKKVVITPRTFGQTDAEVFELCKQYGIDAVANDTGESWPYDVFIEKLEGAEGIIVATEQITAELLDRFPTIRAVAKYGVGIDNVDVAACEERGVKVSRTVGANAVAVADFAFGMALAAVRRIVCYDQTIRQGRWKVVTTPDISGRTIGIIGLGSIGRIVAKRAQGFDMKVLGYDPYWDADYAKEADVEYAEPERIFREADFISLHLPLTPATKDFIGAEQIAMMKPTAVIVNCARGGVVNEDALYEALRDKRIFAAGIDVFAEEPHVDPRWFELDNVIMSPHAAGQSYKATERMGRMAVANIAKDLGLTE